MELNRTNKQSMRRIKLRIAQSRPRGRDSHIKQTGMLVVSLRGINFGFWSRLGCSRQSANILSRQGLVQGSAKKHRITRRDTEVNFLFNFVCRVFISLKLIACRICVFFKRSLLGVKICLSHAQNGLLQGVTKSLSHAQMVSFRG